MSNRITITSSQNINGETYAVTLFQNPTIDDVMIGEIKIAAYEVANGPLTSDTDSSRLTPRAIRDYFIKPGVEQ
jgi:hypothetical protein